MKKSGINHNLVNKVGIFAASFFVTTSAVYLYSPTFGSHASESKEAEVNLTVSSVLALRTSANNLALEANVGDFVHGAIDVEVRTNSQYGYSLTLEDSDDESDLVHSNASISDKLASEFEGAKTSATMDDNTWGFSLDEASYYHVPVLGNPVLLKNMTSVTSDFDTTTVDFGAKVGASLIAGTYNDTVKFTAYVNGADEKPEDGTETHEPGVLIVDACKGKPYVSGGVLTDPRDGNTYTVKALDDGKCWMTQNLAIMDTEITSANSNIPDGETYTIPASSLDGFTQSNQESAYYNETYGGYYTFATATAGWGTTDVETGTSPKDICPKGWRLPTGGDGGELEQLYYKYKSSALLAGDPGFVIGGSATNEFYDSNNHSYYWSSMSNGSVYAYALRYNSYNVNAWDNPVKYRGFFVRCLAK